jgi:hypothetical protein
MLTIKLSQSGLLLYKKSLLLSLAVCAFFIVRGFVEAGGGVILVVIGEVDGIIIFAFG